ncbi:O-acetyl-ADP-ribose deacetylase [Vibrio marisflavi]|uniref:O-acetyl-ADP-ribose deacetylase n=1 Tax=Vibrio marisflavi CECT 7928 TaxID=634439 RepID=A0ABM8ZZL7_9VIBR|nr:O-acetyl-ADP-ribose deacetylase [Vibrio marisflavi]CAH0536365.1 O-acetyl-ADP-ribose deacetylase [Vibrio marisflavi CECT 7928]
MAIKLLCGDITQANVDAIVNAANPSLLGGGGVDGAIHEAAGPELLTACLEIKESHGMRCPFGEAKITPAGKLSTQYVIHTVGPIYMRSNTPQKTLLSAYRNSLNLALHHKCQSIAFPAISCGVYGYPILEAAQIALTECSRAKYSELTIEFYLFDKHMFEAWSQVAQSLENTG